MNESFVEMPQGEEEVPQTPEEMQSVEEYIAEMLHVVNTDVEEIKRLMNAVKERPGFGFEDDLDGTIEEAVARFRAGLEKVKEAGTRGAGQGELELE